MRRQPISVFLTIRLKYPGYHIDSELGVQRLRLFLRCLGCPYSTNPNCYTQLPVHLAHRFFFYLLYFLLCQVCTIFCAAWYLYHRQLVCCVGWTEEFHTPDRWSVLYVWYVWYVWSVWSVWSRSARQGRYIPDVYDIYDLYDMYDLHYLYDMYDLYDVDLPGRADTFLMCIICTSYDLYDMYDVYDMYDLYGLDVPDRADTFLICMICMICMICIICII